MKMLLLGLLTSVPLLGLGVLTRVHDRNVAVEAGRRAYSHGDASKAAAAFAAAVAANARLTPDPHLLLNLAHAQFRAGQTAAAQQTYERLLTSAPTKAGSVARQQLAVLLARQGQLARALGLLRQALVLDPANQGARHNFEVLSDFLNRREDTPAIPPPTAGTEPKPSDAPNKAPNEQEASAKAGTDRPGEVTKPNPADARPGAPPHKRADQAGQPDQQLPGSAPGSATPNGRGPGSGEEQPVGSGNTPGQQRGLDRSGAAGPSAPAGTSTRAGTEAALPEDVRLQTQRERLKAMNLSPTQARRLLEALRAQEQQYLQQLSRPAPNKPDPSKPSW